MYKLFSVVLLACVAGCAAQAGMVKSDQSKALENPCAVLGEALSLGVKEMREEADNIMRSEPGSRIDVEVGRRACSGTVLMAEIAIVIKKGGRVFAKKLLVRLSFLEDGSIEQGIVGEKREESGLSAIVY